MSSNGPWNLQTAPIARPGLSRKARKAALIGALAMLALYAFSFAYCSTNHEETAADQLARCQRLGAASYSADFPRGFVALDPSTLPSLPDGYSRLGDGRHVFVSEGCAFVEPPAGD